MIMTREQFRDAGDRLLGHGWQSALARILDTDPRTVRRWALDERPVPESVVACLELIDALDRAGVPRPPRWPAAEGAPRSAPAGDDGAPDDAEAAVLAAVRGFSNWHQIAELMDLQESPKIAARFRAIGDALGQMPKPLKAGKPAGALAEAMRVAAGSKSKPAKGKGRRS